MASLRRSRASLRIAGDKLIPEEVTELLGCAPTHAQSNGELIQHPSGRSRVAQFGQWRLNAAPSEPADLDAQADEILGKLTADLAVWQQLTARFKVDLFCGWFMGTGNEGLSISPRTLVAIGARGIELALDMYGPDADA